MQNKNYNVIQETKLLKLDGLCIFFSRNKHINILQTICFSWNEWLKLPIKYPDIPRHAQVCFTIWDVYGPRKAIPVGGTTVSLFGKYG